MYTKSYSTADIVFFVMTLAVFIIVPLMFYLLGHWKKQGKKVKVPVVVRDYYNGTLNIIDTSNSENENSSNEKIINCILNYYSYENYLIDFYTRQGNTAAVALHSDLARGIRRALYYSDIDKEAIENAERIKVSRL